MTSGDAAAEYARRRDHHRREAVRAAGRDVQATRLRILAFVGVIALAGVVVIERTLTPWMILAPLVAFFALVAWHDRVLGARRRAERAVGFYERGLARLDDRWRGLGPDGARFLSPQHPYAGDLDLFGEGSLFQRMTVARTRRGEELLAGWLLAAAEPAEIRARQEAVEELRGAVGLREDLARLGAEAEARVDAEHLCAWGERPLLSGLNGRRLVAALLTALPVLAALWVWLGDGPGVSILVAAALVMAGTGALQGPLERIVSSSTKSASDLEMFLELLRRFEAEEFRTPRLRELRARLAPGGKTPSERMAELHRLQKYLDSARNQMFAPIALLTAWPVHFGLAIEAWRGRNGRLLREWLEVVGELEALLSFASYAYERPGDPFPEFEEGAPSFAGEGIGHPLLPPATCVRNDVRLDAARPLLLVSGSNMSGKSTLLRTIGLCAVLAQAGAPVPARSLRLTRLSVGSSLRVNDSVQDGKSRFYAEIERLAQVFRMATEASSPLLFLLDEILAGTNSHDRRIGAEALARGLVERGALGLITTHDLALTRLADSMDGRAANVHFEDHLEAGRMEFDYRMRTGVVEKSNALELMRSVGLDV